MKGSKRGLLWANSVPIHQRFAHIEIWRQKLIMIEQKRTKIYHKMSLFSELRIDNLVSLQVMDRLSRILLGILLNHYDSPKCDVVHVFPSLTNESICH